MLSRSATIRFLASFGNVFLSLILGVIAMGFFLVYLPDEFVRLQRIAASVHEWIMAFGWSTRVESILRFILEGRQLLLMGFVLTFRFLLGLAIWLMNVIWHRIMPLPVGGDMASVARVANPKDR